MPERPKVRSSFMYFIFEFNRGRLYIMSEGFRVAECLYSPSALFCIYDYTKIAYLTGQHICVR